jgi:hypothetical protein
MGEMLPVPSVSTSCCNCAALLALAIRTQAIDTTAVSPSASPITISVRCNDRQGVRKKNCCTWPQECTAHCNSCLISREMARRPIRRQASRYWPLRAALLLLVILVWMLCATTDSTAPPDAVAALRVTPPEDTNALASKTATAIVSPFFLPLPLMYMR